MVNDYEWTANDPAGAPEAVLDWGGGGGGGKDLRGLTIFFCQGLISGVASFLVCRGGGVPNVSTKNCTSDARSICYHNFPNIVLVYLLSSHFKKKWHGTYSFRERAKRASRNFHILRRKHYVIFNSLLVNHIFFNTTVLVFLILM